jgi:hypothetical protein
MIQATRDQNSTTTENYMYVDIYDLMTATTYIPLITIKCQATNKSKSFIASAMDITKKERFLKLTYEISKTDSETLTSGIIYLGDENFPYGFYDVTIYQNNDATNLDPDNSIKTIYKTLMYFDAVNNNSVTYTPYTQTISSPTYITNTI